MDGEKALEGRFLDIIYTLMDRGLSGEDIDRGMKQVVGPDWKEVKATIWSLRLLDKRFIREINAERFVDELEALILGVIRLDQISRNVKPDM